MTQLLLNKTQPLKGRRIVVTRAKEQAGGLLATLEQLGAEAIEFAAIRFVDPESFAPLDDAIARLPEFDWVIFTSVNGVEYFWRRLEVAKKDSSALAHLKICAIGPATAAAIEERGLKTDLVPPRFVAESILESLGEIAGQRILLPRADIARIALIEGLEARGATAENVVAYRTLPDDGPPDGSFSTADMVHLLETGQIDLVTFTSSSTVRNFATRLATASPKPLPELLARTVVACIGPITAGTARELGLTVGLEATEFTIEKLVETIVIHFASASEI